MLGCSLCKYYRILAYNKDNMGTVGGGLILLDLFFKVMLISFILLSLLFF